MKLLVAVTDNDWFEFLAGLGELDEVNFWNPGGRSLSRLDPGTPVLFKLHHPYNHIVGGGFFRVFSVLPLSMAWDAFGRKNGAESLERMRALIERHKPVEQLDPREDYLIGCTVLVDPFFLDRSDWVAAPPDFSPNIVRCKSYDLSAGVGRELWERVWAARNLAGGKVAEQTADPLAGELAHVQRRLGQGAFRLLITETYQRSCAVTREKALPVLEAAHIRPVGQGGAHSINNGLLLRVDLHNLFDRGYLTITPKFELLVSRRLKDDFDDGEKYMRLSGRRVWVPPNETDRPDPELLEWHADTVFKG